MQLISKARVMEAPPTSAATQGVEMPERPGLTKGQKALGICFLLFYLAMIVVTIATLPYASHYLAGGSLF
jgi:hypothetical protein